MITMYTTPTCSYCRVAKAFFKEHNISFNEIDVSKDRKAAEEMIKKSNQYGVPVFDISGKIIVGWDPEEIQAALKVTNLK
ncbi:MAG: hypothetical protein RL557_1069 [archaeon]|jgi:glutaredoxin-like YruB-family protein